MGGDGDPGLGTPPAHAYGPIGVAVDQAHVYWANDGIDSIGRANLNGTGVEQRFITVGDARGLAVTAASVYWANNSTHASTIGRANLDGTGVDRRVVTGIDPPPPPGTPPPADCLVAHLTLETLARARAALAAAHCTLGKVSGPRHHGRRKLVVAKQHPRAATVLPVGSPVNLRLTAATT